MSAFWQDCCCCLFPVETKAFPERDGINVWGQEVSITLDSFQIVGDTCLNQVGNRYPEKRFRLAVYSDSNACSSCRIRELGEWNDFLDKCRKYKDDLDVVFIVPPKRKDRNVVRFALKSQDFVVPVCISRQQ